MAKTAADSKDSKAYDILREAHHLNKKRDRHGRNAQITLLKQMINF